MGNVGLAVSHTWRFVFAQVLDCGPPLGRGRGIFLFAQNPGVTPGFLPIGSLCPVGLQVSKEVP
jgi:hypothetical protein